MHSLLLPRAIRIALCGVAGAATLGLPDRGAHAQDQDDAEALETITVVGSRIKRTDIETSQPVFVIEREELMRTGLVTVGNILQQLATNGASLNTQFNNGGNGANQVSLRNLGANRTLVLVNGRRWVTQLAGQTDLNTIPVAAIERIEVLRDGASAIYGSDAIAGVINITLRDSYDGAEATAYLGENEEGDGRTESYDFTIGSSTDRASVLLNAAYVKQEPISSGDREYSSVPLFGFPGNNTLAGASPSTPFGQFTRANAPGSLTLIPGRPGTAVSDFRPFSAATDGFNFAPDNYLSTPQERTSLYAQARYHLTDNVSFNTTVLYNERRSNQQLAAISFLLGNAPGANPVGRSVRISANNVYNPFGADITAAQFRPTNVLRTFRQDVDTFYFGGGFDGTFELFGRAFSWDASYTYTDNERRDITTGQFDLNRVRDGVGPSFRDAAGVARCGTPTAVIAGCIPLNLFGGPDGFTDAMAQSVSVTLQDTRYNKLYDYSANVTGDLFELPAGPLAFATGYEYRREFGSDLPDALTASGVSTGNTRSPTAGGYSLDEVYAEFNVPILKDVPLAEAFDLSFAARYSDYSNFGETTNPRFGFRWKPFADLLVRGNYSEGFRAPSVSELFLGQTDSFQQVVDPCSAASNPTGAVAQRCSQGFGGVAPVPAGYQAGSQIRVTVGGNPNLAPELARTKTLGLVYSPSWLEGLDVYLDWYNIEVTNFLGANTGGFILNQCYTFGNAPFCAQITRAPDGIVTSLLATVQNNPGGTEVEGYDLTVDYRWDTAFGKFRVNWDTAYTSYFGNVGQPTFGTVLPNGTVSLGNTVGLYFGGVRTPNWRIRSNASTNWQYGDFGATLGLRYRSDLDESCARVTNAARNTGLPQLVSLCSNPGGSAQNPAPAGENTIDDIWYVDLQGTWDTPWNSRIALGVRNLGDEDPPIAFSSFADSTDPGYDVAGRFWYASYTQRF